LYQSNIIGILYTDLSGNIYEANDTFLNMIGYTKEDLKKRLVDWKQLTTKEEDIELDKIKVNELLEVGVASPWEKEYRKKDGTYISVLLGSVMLDKTLNKIIAFVIDITERKKLEERKDEFISIASHELKTPLTSIKGYMQILERMNAVKSDGKDTPIIQKVQTHVTRLDRLISELLDVVKIQADKLEFNFEEIDLSSIVNNAISMFHEHPTHKILYEKQFNLKIRGDLFRLEQVITNLINNAVKYSPLADVIIIKQILRDKDIVISIQDYGIGINKTDLKNLFQRFYRVATSANLFPGLGIGLFISKEIIKRHSGKIWLKSVYGKGSTFYISLPISV
jgi:PAS domain S-box-containing protein